MSFFFIDSIFDREYEELETSVVLLLTKKLLGK
jgi:hypothetical protein